MIPKIKRKDAPAFAASPPEGQYELTIIQYV